MSKNCDRADYVDVQSPAPAALFLLFFVNTYCPTYYPSRSRFIESTVRTLVKHSTYICLTTAEDPLYETVCFPVLAAYDVNLMCAKKPFAWREILACQTRPEINLSG
jgi:hypothetical protein